MWTASSDGPTFLANGSEIAMLTSSGATRHFVDNKLTPESNEKKMHCTYSTRQTIRAGGLQMLPGTATDKTGAGS